MTGGSKIGDRMTLDADPKPGLPARGRGRPPRLSRGTIIQAALVLLDEMSIDRFSMGLLAKGLNAGVMTLYNYFPSRDDLLIAVADEIYSRFDHPAKGSCWQEEVRQWLWATVDLFQRYPVAMKLSLWDGHASPGWLRTWIPVVELIRAQGADRPRSCLCGAVVHDLGTRLHHVPAAASGTQQQADDRPSPCPDGL